MSLSRGLGLRTKFKVKKKGQDILIKIKTTLSEVREPRERHCSSGQTKRCQKSKGKKCTCKCGGANHGTKKRWPKILSWRTKKTKIKYYEKHNARKKEGREV